MAAGGTVFNRRMSVGQSVNPPTWPTLSPPITNTFYYVVFSEGGGSNGSYKLYVTVSGINDDNRHPRWAVGVDNATKDNDATSPSWVAMRSGDTPTGALVNPQIRVYAGIAE